MSKKPHTKRGTSKASARVRKLAVAHAYVTNGRNQAQAIITAGYSKKGATVQACRLFKDPELRAMIDELTAKASAITGLTTERVLLENARIIQSDHRKFFRPDGSYKPTAEWTDDMAAAVASVETATDVTQIETNGETQTVTTERITNIKFWDKNQAIEKGMRYLGLYEKDNRQRAENLAIQINLV